MTVPFRLRRRARSAPVTGLLLVSHNAADLAALVARLGGDAWPPVYRVADGFLILSDTPIPAAAPRTIRLRRLAEGLLIPADADLVPALRSDEAAGLVRDRGLVILPGGRVLEFAPDRPLAPSDVLAAGSVSRNDWSTFPPRPALADRLNAIGRAQPPDEAATILTAGRPGTGGGDEASPASGERDDLRPEDAPPMRRAAGRAGYSLGQFLGWLGRRLRHPGLSRLGARLLRQAVDAAPRLSERLFGRQEAALRELLRLFRSGQIERALRHAPSRAEPGSRGTPATDARLPPRDPRYSLASLLGSAGGGPASLWLGGADVWGDLEREYRRVAQEAVARGDYRRAAFVYGVLLRDLRQAADTLARGGLHRDAAVLFRDRLGDVSAAAVAFENAGDWDEALRLYRQTDQFSKVASLLRRLGDEEGAVAAYVAAADRVIARGAAHWVAGDLLRDEARRPDLAVPYYRGGWGLRPATGATACAVRLIDHYRETAADAELRSLLAEAEDFFRPAGDERAAGEFFNAVANAAAAFPDPIRDELRDRALLAVAHKLRQHATATHRPGTAVTDLFGREPTWPAPVVRDADFAHKRALQPARSPNAADGVALVQVAPGPVTAAVMARGSGDIILGCSGGEVVCLQPDGKMLRVATEPWRPVAGLATDPHGQMVVLLQTDEGRLRLRSFYRGKPWGWFQYQSEREVEVPAREARLLPAIRTYRNDFVTDLQTPIKMGSLKSLLLHYLGPRLILLANEDISRGWSVPRAHLLWAPNPTGGPWWLWNAGAVTSGSSPAGGEVVPSNERGHCDLGWEPAVPEGSPLRTPPIDWLTPQPEELELAGINAEGILHWSSVRWHADRLQPGATRVSRTPGGYRAVAILGPGRVSGVTAANRVVWLRVNGFQFEQRGSSQPIPSPSRAVACFHRPQTGELVVVLEDGWVARLPVPV